MNTARNVTVIPATLNYYSAVPVAEKKNKKVAAYARVSTDKAEQQTSYEMQVRYYTNYIYSKPEWQFVKIYTDEGISAVNTKHRDGFKEMIDDAMSGKIDLIITKSVSRFARNTVDTLTTVRKLKEKGIEIYFEKENIWTLDSKGELLLTIMSSLAQEESRSISENVTWGHRKRFIEGKILITYGNFLGYEKGENGEPKVVESEAKIVRTIYQLFLEGKTPHGIAKYLEANNILSPMGKEKWRPETIMSILQNEKYMGDAVLQKTFIADYLTKKVKKNHGEIPMYYVKESHEGIVSREVYDMVQAEIQKRKSQRSRHSGCHTFSSKLQCGTCGKYYGPKTFHSNSKYRRVVWQCSTKNKCHTIHLYPKAIEQIFIDSFNKILENQSEIIKNCEECLETVKNTQSLEKEKARLCGENQLIYRKIQNCIEQNAMETLDQNEYKANYERLSTEFEIIRQKIEAVDIKLQTKRAESSQLKNFIDEISKRENNDKFL